MGEALKLQRGARVKVADGFPKRLYDHGYIGHYTVIPDLIGCNGFAMFVLDCTDYGDESIDSGIRYVLSVFYDGANLNYSTAYISVYADVIHRKGEFDATTGKITLYDNHYFGNDYTMQCIYW